MIRALGTKASRLWQARGPWLWLVLGVSLLGLALRIEHAMTFDHVHRGSDYNVHLLGVRWMQSHWRPFFFSSSVNYQVRCYPPLWYFLSAVILTLRDNERLLSVLSIVGFALRQLVLWLMLRAAIPQHRLSQLAAMTIHAVLPLAVLIDGKCNPEGLHSGFFALAIYALWRMEQQARSEEGIRWSSALAFGAAAGLALLVKSTGALLVALCVAVVAVQAIRWLRWRGLGPTLRLIVAPAVGAAAVWLAVSGFWTLTNLVKFHHPFPHVWDLESAASNPSLADPVFYRRPLGWALPFEWRQYWDFPLLRSPSDPRPNFWATEISGTWSDIYNRGFCRLKGGPFTDTAWGGRHGFLSEGSDAWNVYDRCSSWMASMLHFGVWLTAASVLALLWSGWQHLRSFGVRGSLALTGAPLLCTFSFMWFALAYPWDNIAVLNPRYLLAQVMPMSACLGLWLASIETVGRGRGAAALLARGLVLSVFGLIVLLGLMLLYERFGV